MISNHRLNMNRTPLFCLALLITNTVGAAEPPPSDSPATYPAEAGRSGTLSARGNEPGWTLEIADQQIQLRLDYGERRIDADLPPADHEDGATLYELADPGIKIRIDSAPCQDDMTGMPYPLKVTLTEAERVLRGCGGDPGDLLDGDTWQVTSIAGEPVPEDIAVNIAFLDDDRVAGSAGCNRMMGHYELTGEGLSFGRLATTMMACPEPRMAVEQRFIKTMEKVIRFELSQTGELLLVTADQAQIRAQRE